MGFMGWFSLFTIPIAAILAATYAVFFARKVAEITSGHGNDSGQPST
jgi:hypothetical protein